MLILQVFLPFLPRPFVLVFLLIPFPASTLDGQHEEHDAPEGHQQAGRFRADVEKEEQGGHNRIGFEAKYGIKSELCKEKREKVTKRYYFYNFLLKKLA